METNVRQSRVFQVRHQRHTRTQSYALTDPRDIYEQNANQGARRLRACILGVIPGDVVEAAVLQCETTLKAEADTSPEALKKLVDAFAQYGVTREMLEVRCQRRIDAIRPAQVVQLRKIWASLRDEMSQPSDWFDMPHQTTSPPATGNEALRQKLAPAKPPEEPQDSNLPQDAAEPLATEDSSPPGSGESLEPDPVPVVLPARKGRGFDWLRYRDEYVAGARTVPPSRLGEFRAKNSSMFDALRNADKELWSEASQELANYERGE